MTSKRYPDKGFNGVELIVGQISSSVTAEIRSMIAFISNKNNIIDAVQAIKVHLKCWYQIKGAELDQLILHKLS